MLRRILTALIAGALALCALSATISPAGASSTAVQPGVATVSHGCYTGYFCIYASTTTWNSGHPSYAFYTYGGHNIYGQYGEHWVFNRQTGNAHVFFCAGPDGSGTAIDGISTPEYAHLWDLGPVNSILLEPFYYKDTAAGYVPATCADSAYNQGWAYYTK